MLSDFNKGSDSLTSDVIPNKGLSAQRVGRVSSRRGRSAQSVSRVWLIYGLRGLGWRGQVSGEEELSGGRAGAERWTHSDKLGLRWTFAELPVGSRRFSNDHVTITASTQCSSLYTGGT